MGRKRISGIAMKRASDTDEIGILSEAFLKQGLRNSGWSVYERRETAPELLALFEEGAEHGEPADSHRSRVMRLMFDLVLEGWERELSVALVGARSGGLAAAVHHRMGSGSGLRGASKALAAVEGVEVVRKILDYWFSEALAGRRWDNASLGKKIVGMAKFTEHPAVRDISITRIAKASGETPAGVMERIKRVCNLPIEQSGGTGRASWQQPQWQRDKSAAAQKKFHQTKKARKKNEQ